MRNMGDNTETRAEGYDRLGRFMGEQPENAIFRRFGALAAEDLLYRQAELAELENDLRSYQEADKRSGERDRQHYAVAWKLLRDSANGKDGNDPRQWTTMLEIRAKLHDYRKTHDSLL